jgi:hypothetical protein
MPNGEQHHMRGHVTHVIQVHSWSGKPSSGHSSAVQQVGCVARLQQQANAKLQAMPVVTYELHASLLL